MPSLNKFETEMVAHLAAIEFVLAQVGKIACLNAGVRSAEVTSMRNNARRILEEETFPGLEAVWSDHLGAGIARHADDILGNIEALVKDADEKLKRPDEGDVDGR